MTDGALTIPYSPRACFQSFHERSQRWSVIVAHRRAGKTVACCAELVTRALYTQKKDSQYAYIAPFASQSKKIAWDYLKDFARNVTKKKHETELWIQLINGSKIFVIGAENAEAMRGLYFDGVVIDEIADMKGSVWSQIIRPALADRKGWMVAIGTPKGHNFFYQLRERAKKDPSRWFYKELKASETKILNPKELEELKEELDDDEYAQEMECSFEAAIKGAYYGKHMREVIEQGRVKEFEIEPSLPVHIAVDLGFSDYLALWFFQIVASEVRLVDYYEVSGFSIDDLDTFLTEEKAYNYGVIFLPHDARAKSLQTGYSIVEQLSAKKWKVQIVPNMKIRDGIQAARKILPRCYFMESTTKIGIEHLQLYSRSWNDKLKVFSETPKHDEHSHCADSFRYLAAAVGKELILDQSINRPASKKSSSRMGWKLAELFETIGVSRSSTRI